jgi:23S rRNA (guanosine2251-2'-O)-methyltransferase
MRGKGDVRHLHRRLRESYPNRPAISFLLQDWEDAYNVGGMFRVADACGAVELFMSGRTPVPPDPMIGVTSLGHHRRIPFCTFSAHEEAVLAAKERGYSPVAIELADGAVTYTEFEWPQSICLVLGNEGRGVYGSVMKHCVGSVFIPMFGKGRSMNVHVAAAIVAYRALLG